MSVDGYRVPAVAAAANLLRALEEAGPDGAGHAQLVRATGISKSTMHNLLATLEAEGFVRRGAADRRYRLGPLLISLGAHAARNTRLLVAAMDAVAPLAAEHGLSFAVAQPVDSGEVQIVERFHPRQDVYVGIAIGGRFGYFDGALGKCQLAALPPGEAEEAIRGRPIPARTGRTITSSEELLADVEETRRRGWAASRQELNQNNAVAAPVGGPTGEPEAYLAAIGVPDQLDEEEIPRIGARLREIAERIGSGAGGRRTTQYTAGGHAPVEGELA